MSCSRSFIGSAFALALTALPANAVTTYTDPIVHPLFELSNFAASAGGGIAGTPLLPKDPAGFIFTYRFDYTATALPLSGFVTTTNNTIGTVFGIASFAVSWILEGSGTLLTFPGGTSTTQLPLPITGIYDLVLTGIATGSNGGFFNVTLIADCNPGANCDAPPGETPIPGAAVLMGTILAGGAGFGAWRRRRIASPARA